MNPSANDNFITIASAREVKSTNAIASSNVPSPNFTQNLADPVLSGAATWIGTIISVIAAFAALKQARTAKKLTARIADEQKRNAINATLLRLNSIENHLTPLWDTTPRRGLKIPRIIADAKQECHRALGSLSKTRDGEIRILFQNLESKLDAYLKDQAEWLADLVASSRRELQDLTSMCNDAIEHFALDK